MSCRCKFRAKGFTLVELVVVKALIALVVLVGPPFLSTDHDSIGLEAAARKVAGDLRLARSEAIARDREIGVALDLGKRRYAIGGEGWQTLSSGIALAVDAAPSGTEREDGIRFFPDGSSSGDGITLSSNSRTYRVAVDWLTGHVSIVE